jgi:glycerol-3-phosphate dehydrogenase (NAD(P)+)
VVGSRYQAVIDDVVELMASEQVRVYGNRDLRGVEVGGAMRTPLALAAGALGGVGAPKAVSAILLTRGMAEAGRMCEALGGERQTVSGLSGIGDWMLTVGDPHDELMLAGARLGRGEACDHPEAEGRVRSLLEQAARLRVDLPIVKAVAALLDGHPVAEVLAGLMTRAAQPEFR